MNRVRVFAVAWFLAVSWLVSLAGNGAPASTTAGKEPERGSIFAVTDARSLRRCLEVDSLVESSTEKPKLKRTVPKSEIRERCIASAASAAITMKLSEHALGRMLDEVARGGWKGDSGPLVVAATKRFVGLCNHSVVYEEIVTLFGRPEDDSPSIAEAREEIAPAVQRCVSDSEFKSDLTEDAKASVYVRKSLCRHVPDAKLQPCP